MFITGVIQDKVYYIHLGGGRLLDEATEVMLELGCPRETLGMWGEKEAFKQHYNLPVVELPRCIVINKRLTDPPKKYRLP